MAHGRRKDTHEDIMLDLIFAGFGTALIAIMGVYALALNKA